MLKSNRAVPAGDPARVQRERQSTGTRRLVQHTDAIPPARVHDQLAPLDGASPRQSRDETGQDVARHGQ